MDERARPASCRFTFSSGATAIERDQSGSIGVPREQRDNTAHLVRMSPAVSSMAIQS